VQTYSAKAWIYNLFPFSPFSLPSLLFFMPPLPKSHHTYGESHHVIIMMLHVSSGLAWRIHPFMSLSPRDSAPRKRPSSQEGAGRKKKTRRGEKVNQDNRMQQIDKKQTNKEQSIAATTSSKYHVVRKTTGCAFRKYTSESSSRKCPAGHMRTKRTFHGA